MKNEKVETQETAEAKPKMRRLVIETDGNNINITVNELAGGLELAAVLQTILAKLSR